METIFLRYFDNKLCTFKTYYSSKLFKFEGNQKEFAPNTKAAGYQQGNGSSSNNENDHSRFNRPNGHHKRKYHGDNNNSGRSNSFRKLFYIEGEDKKKAKENQKNILKT